MVCLRPRSGSVTRAGHSAWAESRIRKQSKRRGRVGGAVLWGDAEGGDLDAELTTAAVVPISFGGLPLDILILILAHLPLRVLVRLRLLCKSWDALLRSRTFLQALFSAQHSSSSSSSSWLVMARIRPCKTYRGLLAPKELIAYCPPLQSWFPLSIDAHPDIVTAIGPGLLQVPLLKFADFFPVLSALTMASSGGLICCVLSAMRTKPHYLAPPPPNLPDYGPHYLSMYVFDEQDYRLLVFNCFTGASKCLPPPPNGPFLSTELCVFMFPDAAVAGAYFVALTDDSGDFQFLRIYSSKTGCWKVGQSITSVRDFTTFEDVQNGDLFHYLYELGTLFAYNIGSDVWSRVSITPALESGVSDSIFKWQGHIFFASALVTFGDEHVVINGFRVCEVKLSSPGSKSAIWVEVARTPRKFWEGFFDFQRHNYNQFHLNFVHSENLVCMTGFDASEKYLQGRYWPPLVYDVACGSWYHLPPYKGTTDFLGLFSFQPHLLATP